MMGRLLPDEAVKQQEADFDKLLDSLGEASLTKTKAFLADRETAEQEDGLTGEAIARLKKRIKSGKEES